MKATKKNLDSNTIQTELWKRDFMMSETHESIAWRTRDAFKMEETFWVIVDADQNVQNWKILKTNDIVNNKDYKLINTKFFFTQIKRIWIAENQRVLYIYKKKKEQQIKRVVLSNLLPRFRLKVIVMCKLYYIFSLFSRRRFL